MHKIVLLFAALLHISLLAMAGKTPKVKKKEAVDSLVQQIQAYVQLRDSVNKVLKYETGQVHLKGGFADLNIPAGFKFLNADQSKYVLHKLWGNPEQPDVLGMVFPANSDPFTDSSFAFIVSFEDMGYVSDKDAQKIDYSDLLKDIQKDETENNKQRTAEGYPSMHITGWASTPYYDEKNKVLHWAKDISFGDQEQHTLNYDVRVLGRKGVLSLNAVAGISELPLVKQNIDKVLHMATFTSGNAYADYNSGTDKMAAYTIGGLVAGKVLAKIGFWALLVKFWKLIMGGLFAAYYAVKKFLTGRGRKEPGYTYPETTPDAGGEAVAELPGTTSAVTETEQAP